MATASGREVYVLGKEESKNREVVVVEDGETHDLPSAAKYAYSNVQTRFPYAVPA
jgi:hypothetical protein